MMKESGNYKDSVREYYTDIAATMGEAGLSNYGVQMGRLIYEMSKEKERVLDLGCGNGIYIFPILEVKGLRLICGVDLTFKMLQIARNRLKEFEDPRVLLINADACKIPLKDCSFDFIFSFSTLYSIHEIELVLENIYSVLRPEGKAILEFGNSYSIIGLYSKWKYSHPHFLLSLRKMRRLIYSLGFKEVQERYFNLLSDSFMRGIFRRVIGLKIQGKYFDEFVSSLGPLRYLSFNCVFICTK